VHFNIEDVESLFSAPLYIQYDPLFFEFIDASEGTFLNQKNTPTVFTHTVANQSGKIIVGLKQGAGHSGASGAGELFNLQFKAKSVGKSEILPIRMNFRNPIGEDIHVKSFGLPIEIVPQSE